MTGRAGGKNRVSTSGDQVNLSQNPFAGLAAEGLPAGPQRPEEGGAPSTARAKPEKKPGWRGRVDVRRESAGRGGKRVTAIDGFQKISKPEIEQMLREMQKTTGSGGTLKAGRIELQGDRVEGVMAILVAHGFRPVRTGG
jgi:translation initiation factor 1